MWSQEQSLMDVAGAASKLFLPFLPRICAGQAGREGRAGCPAGYVKDPGGPLLSPSEKIMDAFVRLSCGRSEERS